MRRAITIAVLFLGGASIAAPTNTPATSVSNTEKQADSEVSDPEKLDRSEKMFAQMNEHLGQISAKATEARTNNDLVKLGCVNEKLNKAKGLVAIAQQAKTKLTTAIAVQDSQASTHEYGKVFVAHQKVGGLRSEVEKCFGQAGFQSGEGSSVEVEVSNVPKGDQSKSGKAKDFTVRNSAASPSSL